MEKIAFVTGANKGIGKQIARFLGKEGWHVIIGARDESRGTAAVKELQAENITCEYLNIDLQSQSSIEEAAKQIEEGHSGLSLLVNNAGIPGDMRKPGYEFSVNELREVMQTDFFGPFELTRLLMPTLERNSGRIANITIPIGASEFFNPFAYKTCKASLNVMTQSLAQAFKAQGKPLEIFGIMPGGTTTDLNGNSTGRGMKTPEEAGKLIVGLILDGKDHNGEVLNENGLAANYNAGLI